MSIMTWKYDFSDDDEPKIVVEYPDDDEMRAIIDLVARILVPITREGYTIHCDGSSYKAPQGVNWEITITFESVKMAGMIAEAIRVRYGPPTEAVINGKVIDSAALPNPSPT